jgi:thiol:disulfide interchange protein DsbD
MFKHIFFLISALFLFNANADQTIGQPSNDQIPAVIIQTGVQSFTYENKNYLTINLEHAPEWHTYWANPGDAGLSTKFIFKINNKEIPWSVFQYPEPERFFDAVAFLVKRPIFFR